MSIWCDIHNQSAMCCAKRKVIAMQMVSSCTTYRATHALVSNIWYKYIHIGYVFCECHTCMCFCTSELFFIANGQHLQGHPRLDWPLYSCLLTLASGWIGLVLVSCCRWTHHQQLLIHPPRQVPRLTCLWQPPTRLNIWSWNAGTTTLEQPPNPASSRSGLPPSSLFSSSPSSPPCSPWWPASPTCSTCSPCTRPSALGSNLHLF